jgi:hypothetical protein
MAMVFFREPWYRRRNKYLFSYEVPGFRIRNQNSNFLTLQTSEFKKYFLTKIFGIKNGIRIPLTMGVPEIGTKNRNSQPSAFATLKKYSTQALSEKIGAGLLS